MDISHILTIAAVFALLLFAVGVLLEDANRPPSVITIPSSGADENSGPSTLQTAAIDISRALNNPAMPSITRKVVFSSSWLVLDSRAIASASQLEINEQQVCLQLGDFNSGKMFDYIEEGKSIGLKQDAFAKAGAIQVSINALCESGENIPLVFEAYPDLNKMVDMRLCSQAYCGAESKEICCIVVLRKG